MRSKEKNNGKVDLTRAKFLIEGVEIFGREGFWNISGEDGKIALIQKTNNSGGGIITPRFSDIHIHLDKTGTSGRIARRATSLFDAISLMDKDKDNWTEEDIYCRANEALEDAWHYGTGSLRTHIDWETQEVPLAWEILNELKSQWKGLESRLSDLMMRKTEVTRLNLVSVLSSLSRLRICRLILYLKKLRTTQTRIINVLSSGQKLKMKELENIRDVMELHFYSNYQVLD